MSSDPATLLALAQEWEGLTPFQLEVIATYLSAVQASLSTDPAALLAEAKNFQCLTPHQLNAVLSYQYAATAA